MARNKYRIYKFERTFKCGHTGVFSQGGYTKEYAEEQASAYFAKNECPSCTQLRKEKEYEEQAKAFKEEAEKEGLPELKGSEKQVRWALSLRDELTQNARSYISNNFKDGELKKMNDALDSFLLGKNDSVWFIDNRKTQMDDLIKKISECIPTDEEKAEKEIQDNVIKELEEERTIIPKNFNGSMIRIFIDDFINIDSHKDRKVIEIAKANGYKWGDRVWYKAITPRIGNLADRVGEISNKFLAEGFGIKLDFPTFKEAKEKAITGKYEQEHKRWIICSKDGKKFVATWIGFDNEIYSAAKKIPGAHWDDRMFIPALSYKELEDFAELYNFKFSEKAKELLKTAKDIVINKAVTVTKKEEEKAPSAEEKLNEILKSPRDVIDDLRDDED